MSFWENLQATRGADTRFSQVDFAQREQQAHRHFDVLRSHRLEAARTADFSLTRSASNLARLLGERAFHANL